MQHKGSELLMENFDFVFKYLRKSLSILDINFAFSKLMYSLVSENMHSKYDKTVAVNQMPSSRFLQIQSSLSNFSESQRDLTTS